jgi:hypothetical protein
MVPRARAGAGIRRAQGGARPGGCLRHLSRSRRPHSSQASRPCLLELPSRVPHRAGPSHRPPTLRLAAPYAALHPRPHPKSNRYGAPGSAPRPGAGPPPSALKAWYANPAATGSTPSLYQDDLLDGLVPEALPPADGGPHRAGVPLLAGPRVHGAGVFGSPGARLDARRRGGAWQQAGEAGAQPQQQWEQHGGPYHPHQQQQEQQEQQADKEQEITAPPKEVDGEYPSPHQQQQQQQLQNHHQQPQQPPLPILNGDAGPMPTQQPPALGTWAQRQYKLPLPRGAQPPAARRGATALSPMREGREGPCDVPPSSLAASLAQPIPGAPQQSAEAPPAAAAAAAAAPAGPGQGGEEEEEEEEEAVARAAWRWRFAKRWQAEQVRGLDPAASAGEGDGMEETLAYLAACGGQGWDLSRTMSDGLGASSGSAPRMLGTMDSVGLLGQEALLVGESNSRQASFTNSPLAAAAGGGAPGGPGGSRRGGSATRPSLLGAAAAGGGGGGRGGGGGGAAAGRGGGAATRELTAATKRAKQLLATQCDLDRAAEERWREAQAPPGGELWVGALLEAVEMDDWGKVRREACVGGSGHRRQGLGAPTRAGGDRGLTLAAAPQPAATQTVTRPALSSSPRSTSLYSCACVTTRAARSWSCAATTTRARAR